MKKYCRCCRHNPCECQDDMSWGHYVDFRHGRCGAFKDIPKIDGTIPPMHYKFEGDSGWDGMR